jgi:hypothetical protein
LATIAVISNIETCFLPANTGGLSSALITRSPNPGACFLTVPDLLGDPVRHRLVTDHCELRAGRHGS